MRVSGAELIIRPSRVPMARMDWVDCIYDSRRSVNLLPMRDIVSECLPYSHLTDSNLRTLLAEQGGPCVHVDFLCYLFCVFSMDYR